MFIGDFTPPPAPSPLDELERWLSRYIKTAQPEDMWVLVLWCAHTHLVAETYTTPRLLLDSPVPGSGKTTVLDHLKHLGYKPVQAAALSSPALLARLLEKEPRTILIDEAEKSLNPKKEGVNDLLAILNSGYRFGNSRPVLVPSKEGAWDVEEMSTFGPVAMAGNSPNLPEDTKQRSIRVLLLPDSTGVVEDSEWQEIGEAALDLQVRIAAWADDVREQVKTMKPDYPEGLRGRDKEKYSPLLKVAIAAGGEWEERCLQLIENELDDREADREAGLERLPRHMKLLSDIRDAWGEDEHFIPTQELLSRIQNTSPNLWSKEHAWGELKPQGFGRMLVSNFNIRSRREPGGDRRRGYLRSDFLAAWATLPA